MGNDPKKLLEKVGYEPAKIFTDRGAQAEVFADLSPFFFDRASSFWLWDKKEFYWKRVDDVDMLNMISEETGHDVNKSKNRTEILNALKQEGRKKIPEPIEPTWIQFRETIVDILSGKEFEATPKYFVTNPIPWGLHEDKFFETPTMDKIFEEWVGKENIQKLYEILAYCLLPSYPLHRIFCFIGAGMNGKSCFLNLLKKFVGVNNCCSTELDVLLKSRFEVTRLHKKLVCQMGETNFNEISQTSTLKKLSGGDLIGMEYKNKDLFEETNYAKIIIATNNLPTTTDKTVGFYRRWMIIDFPNVFSEQKDILDDIPDEEYRSLAIRCSMILKDLLNKRKFTNEGSIEERMKSYESHSNFFEKFFDEFVTENLDGYITKNDFFKKFDAWREENRHRKMSEISVGKYMKKLDISGSRKNFQWMNDGRGGQARVWEGISWKD